jgi:hypothetical protein
MIRGLISISQASEIPATWGTLLFEYVTVFPLKGEGVVLIVRGPKSRSEEVLNAFNELVASFVNLKPYLKGILKLEPHQTREVARARAHHPRPQS